MSWLKTINQAWNSNGQSRSFSLCHFSCQKGQEIRFLLAKADKNSPKMIEMSENVPIPAKNAGFEMIFGRKNNCFLKTPNFFLESGQFWKSHCTTVFKSCYNITTSSTFKPKSFNFTSFLWTIWFILSVK